MLITLYYDDQPPGRTRSRTEPESRPCLIGATAGGYALKMLQRVFRYCANEYKMDVNGKFGLLFSFSVVYTRTVQTSGNVVPHRNG